MIYRIIAITFFAAFAHHTSLLSQVEPWQAQWISHPWPPPVENTWSCFVKEVDVASTPPPQLIARISADSKYWLWINEKLVVFEGQLKRGPTPSDTYYDEVDIGPFLLKGKNVVAALVWFWGRDGYCHNNSGKSGFLFDAQAEGISILSDKTWKSVLHPAFGNTSDPIPNYRLPEYNVKFYATQDIPDWKKPGATANWSNASVGGAAGTQPWNKLWLRPFPQWKDSGLKDYENQIPFPFVSDGKAIAMKLPANYTITPYLTVEASKDQLIDIRTDNYKGGSEYNLRTEYVTRDGMQEFETYGYINGHEVIYTIPRGIKVLALKYRRTSFPTEHIGKFKSSDEDLNKLWEKSLNTMDVNMRDGIQDPDRERAQWWGDAVIILGEILYTCDTNGHKAVGKAISNLVEWQKPDGVLYSPVPAGEWHEELPTQMLAAIGKHGFWRYYQFTGDTGTIKYVYPHVKKYMSLWQLGDDGLVKHRDGGWNWHDWGQNIDSKVIENAWYYMALDGAMQMARLLQHHADAESYAQLMQKIKQNFNAKLWNGTAYRDAAYTGQTDDRGHGLAVVAGLADAKQYEAIRNVLAREFHAGPYLEKYIIEALFQMNAHKEAVTRMKNRYSKMIASPLTTLWEGWDIGSAVYGGGSYNHGWSGGPLTLMHQYIAGIAPVTPDYNAYHIMPQTADIKNIYCLTPTRKGNIVLDLQITDKSLTMSVESPQQTSAVIGIPKASWLKKIYVNDRLMVDRKKPVGTLAGITYKGEDKNYLLFSVDPGKWNFSGL